MRQPSLHSQALSLRCPQNTPSWSVSARVHWEILLRHCNGTLDIGITVRGGVDGVFGPATAQALKAFQDQRGLEKTGIVDEVTAIALSKDSSEGKSYGSTTGYGVYGEGGSASCLCRPHTQSGITLRGGPDGWFAQQLQQRS